MERSAITSMCRAPIGIVERGGCMSTDPRKINIIDGPKDDELIDAFKYAFDRRHKEFTVEFQANWDDDHMKMSFPVTAQVTGLSYESGTRGMLLIEANLSIAHGRNWKAIGFYNAQTRTGFFEPGHFGWERSTD